MPTTRRQRPARPRAPRGTRRRIPDAGRHAVTRAFHAAAALTGDHARAGRAASARRRRRPWRGRARAADVQPAARALHAPPLVHPGRRGALARLAAGPLIGVVGPLVLWPGAVLHVALPVMAALHGRPRRDPGLRAADAARVAEGLEWLLGLYAWAAMVAGAPPRRGAARPIAVPHDGLPPPARSTVRALAPLLTGLPAALALAALGLVALGPWLAAVAVALVTGRQPRTLWRLQAALLVARAAHLRRQAVLLGVAAPLR